MNVDWDRVDALVGTAPSLADLRAHGLELFAARRLRGRGLPVPPALADDEVQATWRYHAARSLLEKVRAACDGPILLVKGPAVAERYPEPTRRPFVDIDLIVPDAHAVQDALLSAGFVLTEGPTDYPEGLHHLPPIHLPEQPIPLEVHSRLKWLDHLPAPSLSVLSANAEDSALGVEGISTPTPARHALVLAGHLWAHDPLTRLLRILDIAVLTDGEDPRTVEVLAEQWGMGRLWRSTAEVADALFGTGAADPLPLRTWARALREAREPRVGELHLSRVMSPFAVYEGSAAGRGLATALAGFIRPHDGEGWRRKAQRTVRQVTRPSMRRSEHVEALSPERDRPVL